VTDRDALPPQDTLIRLAYLALLIANSVRAHDFRAVEGAVEMVLREGKIYLTDPPPKWTQGLVLQCAVNLITDAHIPKPPDPGSN
jgi:hypothetical protein